MPGIALRYIHHQQLRSIVTSLALALSQSLALAAGDADYPSRPVRFLVPAPPGGTVDMTARLLGPRFTEQMEKPFVVDNRGGAGGVIAAEMIAAAKPDGHTLSMVYTSYTTNAAMRTQSSYSPVTDNTAITQVSWSPLVLAAHNGLPVKTLPELIQLAKSKTILYGSAGNGSGGHMSGALFTIMAGISATHVPYKGAALATSEVLSGQVAFQFAGPITVLSLGRANKLKLLAVTSLKRASHLPEIPTVDESGVTGFEVINWFGIVAPPLTPKFITHRLHREAQTALARTEVRTRLINEAAEITASTPAEFQIFLKQDLQKWARIVQLTGIRAE